MSENTTAARRPVPETLTKPYGDVVLSFMNIRLGYLALVATGLAGRPTRGAFMIG